MGCDHCVTKVKQALLKVPHIVDAAVSLNPQQATVTMDAPVAVSEIEKAVSGAGHYEVLAGK